MPTVKRPYISSLENVSEYIRRVDSSKWPSVLSCPDIMRSQSYINSKRKAQYFWEAFAVGLDPTAKTICSHMVHVPKNYNETM